MVEFVWQQLSALGIRLWWLSQTVSSGGQAQDPIAVSLLVTFLGWSSAVFATWQIYRRRSALLGLAPGGVAMVLLAFFRGGMVNFYLVVYFFCAVWLVAICHLWRSRAGWQEKGTDYPGDLGVELLISLGPLLLLILAVAALFPVIYPRQIRDRFWDIMDAPWSRVEQAAERVLGPIQGGSAGSADRRGGAAGELPRVHLLGGRPELADTIVLYASTSDPPPPPPSPDADAADVPALPRRYWRADTFDTYTGLGWINSPLEAESLAPNQFLESISDQAPSLLQQFQRVAPDDNRVYAVNTPARIDQPVRTWWRDGGDLAFITAETDLYTVVSLAPEPTSGELRALSPLTATLPSQTAERYLALPDVPQRVLDLAQEVVANATTRYDQARAIERYLRTYPYNLDIPEPLTDRDLVDYFLFELQEGYCDYYASAMVVMARSVGVPARLASGYVQGAYDYESRRWVVTEQEAHSWVEVYFNDLGWVEFEPTGGRPELARPGTPDQPAVTIPPLPPRQVRWWREIPWGLAIVGALLAALLALVVWLWRPRRAPVAAEVVRDRQERLIRWGRRLGHPLSPGQTAREYNQGLGQALAARVRGTRLSRAKQAGAKAPAEIEALAHAFEQVQYSARPVADREAWQVRNLWVRLRRHLWWLWLAPGPKSDAHPLGIKERHES
jgi:transglutaminase-like putative cysteine protease